MWNVKPDLGKEDRMFVFYKIKNIKCLNQQFILEASKLLQRLNLSGVSDSQLPNDISIWISSAAKELLFFLPKVHSDYDKINEIQTRYANTQSILLPSAYNDVCNVLDSLRKVGQCIVDSVNADYKNIPSAKLSAVFYEQIKNSTAYITAELIEKLKDKDDGKTRRAAMLHIYSRIYSWVQSMVKLDAMEDCLALAGSLRAILELFIDINLMARRTDPNDVERYSSFEEVAKWKSARNIQEIRKRFDISGKHLVDSYLAKPGEEDRIEALRLKLWGKTKKGKPVDPLHWTGTSIKERINSLKDGEIARIYASSYYYCNFLVHSMYFDAIHNPDSVHVLNYNSYRLANQMFLMATKLINDITQALPVQEIESRLRTIEEEMFKHLVCEMVRFGPISPQDRS
jgi:hypothetical protein